MTAEHVLNLIIAIIGFGVIFIGYAVFKALNRIAINPEKKPLRMAFPLKQSIEYDLMLSRLIHKLKDELCCVKVVVARFHNGGSFNNGLAMKKFSVYMETPSANPTIPSLQDQYRDIFNTRYPEAFTHLVVWGESIWSNIEDCEDINFRNDAKKCGFNSVNLFLIKQLNGVEEGFVGINYKDTHVMTPEQRAKVKDKIPQILGLLNMTKV